MDFPGGSEGKASAYSAGDLGSKYRQSLIMYLLNIYTTHTCTHMYIHLCIVCICAYTYMCTYACTYAHTYTCEYMYNTCLQ